MVVLQDLFVMFLVFIVLLARFSVADSNINSRHNRGSGVEHGMEQEALPEVGDRTWHISTIESPFIQNLKNSGKMFPIPELQQNSSQSNLRQPRIIPDSSGPLEDTNQVQPTRIPPLTRIFAYSPEVTAVNDTGLALNSSQFEEILREIFSMPESWSDELNLTNTDVDSTEEIPHSSMSPGNFELVSLTEEQSSKRSFPKDATINLSIQILDCSVMVPKLENMFTSNVSWSTDGRNRWCPQDFRMCLSLCCSLGEVLIGNRCVKDDHADLDHLTAIQISLCKNNSEHRVHTSINQAYVYDWMVSRDVENFSLLEYGLLSAPDLIEGWLIGPENYCLFREPGASRYLVKVWTPEAKSSVLKTYCCISIIVIMLVILICYNINPELKNLHGVIFQSYVVTDIASYVCILGLDITNGSEAYSYLFTIFKNTAYYSGCACVLWLHVMSISIWRTFRSFRSVDHNFKKNNKKKFMWYAIYAWGNPAVLVATCVAVIHYEPKMKDIFGRTLTWWTNLGVSVAVFICNIFLYISTAFTIRQLKKDTAHLTDGVNKHQEVAKQWLNMYVKLFVIMTGPMGGGIIPLVIWLVWPIPLITGLLYVVQLVQSIFTFYVFAWNDNMRRLLRARFSATFHRLHVIVEKSESTAAVGSGSNSTIWH